MSNDNNIENIFRKEFAEFTVDPSERCWPELEKKIARKEFLHFSPNHFNIYYLSAVIVGIAVAVISLRNLPSPVDKHLQNQPVNIEKKDTLTQVDEVSVTSMEMENKLSSPIVQIPSGEARGIHPVQADTVHPYMFPSEKTSQELSVSEGQSVPSVQPVMHEIDVAGTKLPGADYFSSPKYGCVPLMVMFISVSEYADKFYWHFGDGQTSTEENPSHLFAEAGEYPVMLRVTSNEGESVIVKDTIRVYNTPEAVFDFFPELPSIPGEPVHFNNYSKNAVRYLWDFGDGSYSEDKNPVHSYSMVGEVNITLTVWSDHGCRDTLFIQDAFGGGNYGIIFPNAFTPNTEGPTNGYYNPASVTNEVFYPVCQGVMDYHLEIYSRTGALLFVSDDVNYGWDGYIKGTLAKQDVYVWKVSGTYANGKSFERYGNVTLIRKK